jgi:AcrR family transcriptional regulator
MARNKRRRDRSYHHGDLPSALIAEARQMLEKAGPESISFRAIARAAGVSQTAPYNHFTSKEHLLATLATIGFRELEESQAAATRDAGTIDGQIDGLGRAYVRFACRHPQLYRLMFGVGMSNWRARQDVAEAKKASFRPLQEALAASLMTGRGNSAATVETAAVAAWALAHGLSMLLIDGALDVPHNVGTAEMLAARVVAWLVAGLQAGAESLEASSAAKGSAPLRKPRKRE